MRRGRPSASSKSAKPCFVRLEKISPNKDEKDEEEQKKLSGPIKKRPVVMKKTTQIRVKKEDKEPDLADYTLVQARTRRTPKPNPKYSNDSIVTPKSIKGKFKSGNEYDDDDDEADADNDDDDDVGYEDAAESAEEQFPSPEEESSEEEYIHRKRAPPKSVTLASANIVARNRLRKGLSSQQQSVTISGKSNKVSTPNLPKMRPVPELRKRKIEFENSLMARNKRLNIELYDATDSDGSIHVPPPRRMYRFNKPQEKQPPPRPIHKEPPRATIENYRQRANLELARLNRSTPEIMRQQPQRILPKPRINEEYIRQRLQIEAAKQRSLQDTIRQPVKRSIEATKPQRAPIMESLRQRQTKPVPPEPVKRPSKITPPKATNTDEDDDDLEATTGVASTIDDFETMPTFTIVNINDIINKKGDVLIHKAAQQQQPEKKSPQPQQNKPNDSQTTVGDDDSDDDMIGDNGDTDDIYNKRDTKSTSPQQSRNRRKTMHTTILSDKIDTNKKPPPRSPFPPRKSSPYNNNNVSPTKSTGLLPSKDNSFKPAPRILNSVIAQKSKPVSPLISKLDLAKDNIKSSDNEDTESKLQSSSAKENVRLNSYGPAALSKQQSTSAAPIRRLPSEKILVQRQGNKLIKKITSVETWYVINIPPHEPPVPKSILTLSMIQLGNNIKNVCLPSDEWSYKITLQKKTALNTGNNLEVYTGEFHDAGVDESEKQNYLPCNIVFRRASRNNKLRMQFDRAVIFKNKTYFTNVDGKNIRLVGSPQHISSLSEVEILLQIVDDLSLVNSCVEQTTFVL